MAASRRARESLEGLEEGAAAARRACCGPTRGGSRSRSPTRSTDRQETLLYLTEPGELAAYEELRAGFTAAVSHELRTPLARILALLETATLPGFDPEDLVAAGPGRGRADPRADRRRALPVRARDGPRGRDARRTTPADLDPARGDRRERRAARGRAGITLAVEGDDAVELPLRPRMLRVVAENLTRNAIRYAGPGATFTLSVSRRRRERRADGIRHRRRRRRSRPPTPVRALLPHRPGASLARHGSRPRDRQARRHVRRRRGRGGRGARGGRADDPLSRFRSP